MDAAHEHRRLGDYRPSGDGAAASSSTPDAVVLSRTTSRVLGPGVRQREMEVAVAGNYRFEVVAINANGTGPRSARSANVVPRWDGSRREGPQWPLPDDFVICRFGRGGRSVVVSFMMIFPAWRRELITTTCGVSAPADATDWAATARDQALIVLVGRRRGRWSPWSSRGRRTPSTSRVGGTRRICRAE